MKSTLTRLRDLKLRHLHFLVALADERNLGRAATVVHLTQPAASRMLIEMERTFGRTLFERGRHGVQLMPGTEQVLRFARMACAEERLVAHYLESPDNAAPVRIGCLPSIHTIVVDAVRACKQQRTVGKVTLREDTLDRLMPLLADGELDLVVGRYDPLLPGETFCFDHLVDEPLSVVAGPAHPLLAKARISRRDLPEWPWLVPVRTSSLYPHFAALFAALEPPKDLIECASALSTQAFIQDNATLGLLSFSVAVRLSGSGMRVLPVRLNSTPGGLGIYRVRDRLVSDGPAAMAQALLDAAGI
jgi:DNA-binding transcriptional LysR family regulator